LPETKLYEYTVDDNEPDSSTPLPNGHGPPSGNAAERDDSSVPLIGSGVDVIFKSSLAIAANKLERRCFKMPLGPSYYYLRVMPEPNPEVNIWPTTQTLEQAGKGFQGKVSTLIAAHKNKSFMY